MTRRRFAWALVAVVIAGLGAFGAMVLVRGACDVPPLRRSAASSAQAGDVTGAAGREPSIRWATSESGSFSDLADAAANVVNSAREAASGPRRVRGRVIDESRAPLARARCDLEGRITDEDGEHPWSCAFDWSAEDGTFELQLEPRARDVALIVTRHGHRDVRIGLDALGDDATVMLVAYPPLTGTVVWPNGTPVRRAQLVIADGDSPHAPTCRVDTDELGRFEVGDLGAGPVTVQVRASRMRGSARDAQWTDGIADERCTSGVAAPVVFARPFDDVRLMLQPDLPLFGRVVDEHGAAWESFRISAVRYDSRDELPAGDALRRTIDTRDGAFELRGLYPGVWRVSAACGPRTSEPITVVLGASGEPAHVELVCARGASIHGRVVDASGAAVAGAQVHLFVGETAARRVRAAPDTRVESDGNGNFRFDAIEPAPNTIELVARRNSEVTQIANVRIDLHGEAEPIELRLPASGLVRVRAFGRGGAGAVRAKLLWSSSELDGEPQRSGEVDGTPMSAEEAVRRACRGVLHLAPGRESVLRLAPGTYSMRAVDGDWVSATQRVTVQEGEQPLDLQLQRAVEVLFQIPPDRWELGRTLRILDARGAPVGELVEGRIRRGARTSSFESVRRTLSDGPKNPWILRATALLPGTYRVLGEDEPDLHVDQELVVPADPEGGVITVELGAK